MSFRKEQFNMKGSHRVMTIRTLAVLSAVALAGYAFVALGYLLRFALPPQQ